MDQAIFQKIPTENDGNADIGLNCEQVPFL
jgi:hypothetical protein